MLFQLLNGIQTKTRIPFLILALFVAWNLGIRYLTRPTVHRARENDPSPKLHIVDSSALRRSSLIWLRSLGAFQLDPDNHITKLSGAYSAHIQTSVSFSKSSKLRNACHTFILCNAYYQPTSSRRFSAPHITASTVTTRLFHY